MKINAILSEIHYQAEVLKSSLLVSLIQVAATVFGLGLLIYSAVHSNPALQGLLQQYAGSISSAFWSVAIFLWVLRHRKPSV